MTILPFNWPRHLSKSRTRLIGATMTGAEIVPLVEGVQAIGIAVSWIGRGDTMRTLECSIDQPRPKSQPSRWTLRRPHLLNCSIVHASAARICGELLSRGPIT